MPWASVCHRRGTFPALSMSERLDKLLLAQGLAASRTQARRMIEAGRVSARLGGEWQRLAKPGERFDPTTELYRAPDEADHYVSRGALKLRGALERTGLDPSGVRALDVGQSTGGFTDCLLRAGAAKVVGVDVGRDQLAPSLKTDSRVGCFEGINARDLPVERLLEWAPGGFGLVVMDVSFISQGLILPGLPALMAPGGQLLSLVKPQFEVGRAGIGKGGLVRDARLYRGVEQRLCRQARELGLTVIDFFDSSIAGGDGNREFFLLARLSGPAVF